jgi:hypothetical protein
VGKETLARARRSKEVYLIHGRGLYKLNPGSHSLKAPGFNPRAYEVKTRFQNLLFQTGQLVPLRRGGSGEFKSRAAAQELVEETSRKAAAVAAKSKQRSKQRSAGGVTPM